MEFTSTRANLHKYFLINLQHFNFLIKRNFLRFCWLFSFEDFFSLRSPHRGASPRERQWNIMKTGVCIHIKLSDEITCFIIIQQIMLNLIAAFIIWKRKFIFYEQRKIGRLNSTRKIRVCLHSVNYSLFEFRFTQFLFSQIILCFWRFHKKNYNLKRVL